MNTFIENNNDELAEPFCEEVIEEIISEEIDDDQIPEAIATLEAYHSLLKQTDGKVSTQTAAFLKVGIEHIDNILGYQSPMVGLESFDNARPHTAVRETTISLEDIKDRLNEAGKKAWEYILKLIEKLKEVYNKYLGPKKKVKEKATLLIGVTKAYPSYPGGKMRGNVPAGTSTELTEKAEELKERKENDEPSEKLIIEDSALFMANGKNTYADISIEKKYIDFIYEDIPQLYIKLVTDWGNLLKTEEDAEEYIQACLEIAHTSAENLCKSKIGDTELPGGGVLKWDIDSIGWIIDKSDLVEGGQVETELRSNKALETFAKEIQETISLMMDGNTVNKHNNKIREKLETYFFGGEIDNRVGAISALIKRMRSLDTMEKLEKLIVSSLNRKLYVVERELALY